MPHPIGFFLSNSPGTKKAAFYKSNLRFKNLCFPFMEKSYQILELNVINCILPVDSALLFSNAMIWTNFCYISLREG